MVSRFASVTSEEIKKYYSVLLLLLLLFFCGACYLTVLVYTKTTIHLSVGG